MSDPDKARKFRSWKGTIIGILHITIVSMIVITLLAQFEIGEFKIADKIFNCTMVSQGNFSWPHIVSIGFAILWCVMIASAFAAHYKFKKDYKFKKSESLKMNSDNSTLKRLRIARQASIIRLERGMTKRVVMMIVSYTLLYVPCKF